MARTKISEFSSTPGNNTDIDGINLAEGCAPSGINDAIRELMAQLKDFQAGTSGDSFNGPVGTTTAAAGAFTTLSATGVITSTLATGTAPLTIASTTKVANLNVDLLDGADWASPAALGSTTAAAVSATTLTTSSTVTHNGGTANGVAYLNGSKVLTTGSALWFDGTNFGIGTGGNTLNQQSVVYKGGANAVYQQVANGSTGLAATNGVRLGVSSGGTGEIYSPTALISYIDNSEQMRLTSTGLGIGTSSPAFRLDVGGGDGTNIALRSTGTSSARFRAYVNGAESGVIGFLNGGGQFFEVAGTEAMRLTSTGLGIGTSSPAQKLQVNGGLAVTSSATLLNAAGSSILFSYEAPISRLYFGDGTGYSLAFSKRVSSTTTDLMTLTDTGNLGLGVTPSAWGSALRVLQIGYGSVSGYPSTTGAGIWVAANAYYDNTNWRYQSTAQATYYNQLSGVHAWHIAPSGTAGNAISFTQAMTLDASGRLGVGVTSPAQKIHTDGRIRVSTDNSNGGDIAVDSSGLAFSTLGTTQPIVFLRNNYATESARIDSSGNLLINTTSSGSLPGNGYVFITATSTQYTGHASGTASGTGYQQFWYNGASIGSITQNGTTGVLYNLTSDYRLKNNAVALTGAKDFVMALQPKTWDWWDGSGKGVGFIAHEFMEVAKYSGNGEKDAVDADGKPVYQSIQPSSSEVMANLVALVQEQQAIIESLKARLDAANI